MFIKKFIIGLLSFYAVEVRRLNLRSVDINSLDTQIERTFENKKKKEKKVETTYDNRKWKKKKKYIEKNFKIKGTNPKDHRFSNQKRLRRMYRNS